MREHYDFSNGIKNPYADKLKKQITIRLDDEVINYSCGGFNTPTLCVVTKGIKADCNHLMRTTYPDACVGVVDFKNMAEETGMPYQNIINYYLKDCVKENRHLEVAFPK